MAHAATGLYLHIPFCHTRCVYCDFNTYVDLEHLKRRYVQALSEEARIIGRATGRPPAATIFFGGGTPTALEAGEIGLLIDACRNAFEVIPRAEVTVEANPGTVTTDYLRALREVGVNRLSFGVQSFHDDELRFLGRLHDAATAQEAVSMARAAGFDNVSLDLIYGLPRQSLERWQVSVERAIALAPEHLSLYSLIVEPGTPLHAWVRRGEVPAPEDDVAAEMYEYSIERLSTAGYTHYEISNWARNGSNDERGTPTLASQHNLVYWRNQCYWGLGAGAHSFVGGRRYANVKRPERYVQLVAKYRGEGEPLPAPARDGETLEVIDLATGMGEQMMLGLRLVREGVSAAEFRCRFGSSLEEAYGPTLAQLEGWGLIERLNAGVCLTPRGIMVANQVVEKFL
ncbi:MAG TPA: radical SAM family heme chaperone HemW [Ardenticatenaceae bacterium]|nr:radical SAM family heme chaperone HemW [Ardenticatenaceae bacterium]